MFPVPRFPPPFLFVRPRENAQSGNGGRTGNDPKMYFEPFFKIKKREMYVKNNTNARTGSREQMTKHNGERKTGYFMFKKQAFPAYRARLL